MRYFRACQRLVLTFSDDKTYKLRVNVETHVFVARLFYLEIVPDDDFFFVDLVRKYRIE